MKTIPEGHNEGSHYIDVITARACSFDRKSEFLNNLEDIFGFSFEVMLSESMDVKLHITRFKVAYYRCKNE